MDAVNPDYLVVKVLNRHHAPIIAWLLDGNYLADRFPLLIALYHGSQPFWMGLPFYALFGTSVEGIRLTHAMFGVVVLAAAYFAMLRLGARAPVAALACAALGVDPAFTFAFRTQSQITLSACAWLLLAIATLPWRAEALARRWSPAASGLFYGWSIVAYFIYGFFLPAIAVAVGVLSWRARGSPLRYAGRWVGGLALGLVPGFVGYAFLVAERGGLAETLSFIHAQQSALGAFSSKLGFDERLAYAWLMLRGVVGNAWQHSMMFSEWVEVPLTPVKLALLAGLPVATLGVLEVRRRGSAALRLLVALPACFVAVALAFGNRLGGHHYIVLLPLLYAALAVAAQHAIGALRAPRGVFAGVLVGLVAVNAAGQRAEGRRLEETHGVGLMSDAINHLAEDLARMPRAPFVYFPDWGLAMPVALMTDGRVGMDSIENFDAARQMLCAGKDVGVALMTGDRAARREQWRAALRWSEPDVTTYRQHDGTPLIDLVVFRGQAQRDGC